MDKKYVTRKDLLNMHKYLAKAKKSTLQYIANKLSKRPELLEKAIIIIRGKEPYKKYIENGFAGEVSEYIGIHVHCDRFIDVMALLIDIPNHEELFQKAIKYKMDTDPKEYYKKGFGMDFR